MVAILCVDDEPRVLEGIRRNLEFDHDVFVATGGHAALDVLAENAIDVIVSDMRMPRMDGAQLLSQVRNDHPTVMRILLTGQADAESALRAVNEGGIFRFLKKPCSCDDLLEAVEDAMVLKRTREAELELLQTTVTGAVETLAEVLAVACPASARRNKLARVILARVAATTEIPEETLWALEAAALLRGLGEISLPADVVERLVAGQDLSATEQEMVKRVPALAAEMVRHIPRFEAVADFIANSEVAMPTSLDAPQSLMDLSCLLSAKVVSGTKWSDAVKLLCSNFGNQVGTALGVEPGGRDQQLKAVRAADLRAGMSVCEDVLTSTGQIVMKAGTEITVVLASRLANFAANTGLKEPIRVQLPA